jgi:5-(hydroxymethyl)furfural/furfural oxidase
MPTVALDPFPSAWNARAKSVSAISRANFAITSVLAGLMDSSAVVRRALVRLVITQGDSLATLATDDATLERYIRRNVAGNWHPTSSCRMGAASDPMAVTDPEGRVRAVRGLRVVDASVMPFCPRANTNLPTIMLAEKLADAILA